MKVYAVITVARQVEGEYVFIKTEKAFQSSEKAEGFLQGLKAKYTSGDRWTPQLIKTPNGEAICQCEAGVFEIEIEE